MSTSAYVVPTKRIVSPSDLHAWIHSDSYTLLDSFVEDLSKSVEDKRITADIKTSPVNNYKSPLMIECGCFNGNPREYRQARYNVSSREHQKPIRKCRISFVLRCISTGSPASRIWLTLEFE